MRTINTVCGTVSADEVKRICPHEHLFLDLTHQAIEPKTEAAKSLFYGDIQMKNIGTIHRNPYVVQTNLLLDNVDDAIEETDYLTEFNCNLFVDVTTVGLGRDFAKLKAFCKKTKLNIVAGTGLYVHNALPKMYEKKSAEQIAAWMIDEIRYGHCDTGIRPGVIGEIGVSEVIYPIEEKSLYAAAITSVETDLPVYLHTYPWSHAGLDAVRLLLKENVKPENICICHLDVTFDDPYIRDVLNSGVYLEFDNFSKEFYFEPQDAAFAGGPFATDIERVRKLKELVKEGYTKQLLLANDLCLKGSLHRYGGWGYDHVFRNIIPMMRMEGIAESVIQQIIDVNPKQFLFQII